MYCREYIIDSYRQDKFEHLHYHAEGRVYRELLTKIHNFVGSTSFPLIRTKCLMNIGGFDELMMSVQDWDCWIRLAKDYELAYVDEPLVNYYAHKQEHIGGNKVKVLRGMERLFLKNEEALSSDNDNCWNWIIWLVPSYRKCGEYRNMFRYWRRAVKLKPFRIAGNIYMLLRGILPLTSAKNWLYIHNKGLFTFLQGTYRTIKRKVFGLYDKYNDA